MSKIPLNPVLDFGPSVWPLVNGLVAATPGTLNLGQGSPDTAPDFVEAAAAEAVLGGLNQYTASQGHPRLVEAIAADYASSMGQPDLGGANVAVAVGGCEALCASFFALITPGAGDEIIIMEPAFDCYDKQVKLAGGRPVFVPLVPGSGDANSWQLDMAAVEAVTSDATRAIVVTNPHNPLGKVWSRTELEAIAAYAQAHNVVVISDEVYDRLAYDADAPHIRMASLPGMFERTLTIGSAGKTFSVTGWKIGWAVGPAPLVKHVWLARQWMSFTLATPLQEATAVAFELAGPDGKHASYFADYAADMDAKRKVLYDGLLAAGLNPIYPRGSYFVMANIAHLEPFLPPPPADSPPASLDMRFTEWLIAEHGVACIPCGWAFYSADHAKLGASYVRFSFSRSMDLVEAAVAKLAPLAELAATTSS
ncbi:cysteine conjugate beta-lyase [Thecamonas trahens ATCC 50062]|uniref:Cysteine conjugate beta-lyase n=1 Tax=Thecamonas trahens ATCC 50062 TaxID=461836 RepID=A0A0L0DKL0_THETB|nr:cysteine conjugate beta-lyase [Thecamonas trahens ATCC 50062]KNC52566.1 cysteine conjugate beta-lyase [Thecamonas trahens ATCC 50062]|eukprot:XP_013755356.1 cysteine conjugate beta-lyase [Thecamonas trahens ATCC 50062]